MDHRVTGPVWNLLGLLHRSHPWHGIDLVERIPGALTVFMTEGYVRSGHACAVACIEAPRQEASALGVPGADAHRMFTSFEEKPEHLPRLPGRPDRCMGSLGI